MTGLPIQISTLGPHGIQGTHVEETLYVHEEAPCQELS